MTSSSADPNLRLLDPADGREIVTPKITVDQLALLLESGAVEERPSWELLDGVVVRINKAKEGEDAMTVHPGHVFSTHRLMDFGAHLRSGGCHLRIQAPLSLPPFNLPEPDGCIVRGDLDRYTKRHPVPEDILCVIEVSDASLETDRRRKLRLYAEHGLPMYVILNLRDRVAEVYTEPRPDAANYGSSRTLSAGQSLPLTEADGDAVSVDVGDLLPAAR